MTKKDEVKKEEAKPEEQVWQSINEVGFNAPRKEPMEHLGPGHSYEDRIKAQATSLGIGQQEGESIEHLMFRIRMGGSA